jgi:hypothetical protein
MPAHPVGHHAYACGCESVQDQTRLGHRRVQAFACEGDAVLVAGAALADVGQCSGLQAGMRRRGHRVTIRLILPCSA